MPTEPTTIDPTTMRWPSADPLGEALHFLHMDGVFYTRSEVTAPWGMALPPLPHCLMFHVVTAGACWLAGQGIAPRLVRPGEFVLLPHGEGHELLSEPGLPTVDLFDLPRETVGPRYEILRYGDGGTATHLICGAVRFDHPAAHQLIRHLPKLITIAAWSSPQGEWFQSTLRLIAAEAQEMRPGGETIITRLADILVIQAIRAWMAEDPAARRGWLGALHDPQIGRAILLMQREPAQAWTVETLAQAVAMSRSAFAARFKQLVGESPMHYLTWWRMQLAATSLQEEDTPVGEVAERLGYQSEAAFNRAFKRFIGLTPGAVRRSGVPAQA